jgi:hypothetical protein
VEAQAMKGAVAALLAALLGVEAVPGEGSEGAAGSPPDLRFLGHLGWITALQGVLLRDSPVNPANQVLRLPQGLAATELRPDLRLQVRSELVAVVRPRLMLEASGAEGGRARVERTAASSAWIEAYATWRLDDRLAVSYGIQNFQWGPGELLSPSNRIFHATGFYRDPRYVVLGRHLARVNLSAGREWSAVFLGEVAPNGEPAFVAGEPFESKAQAKLEYTAAAGDWSLGLTAGAAQRSRAWFGELATLPLFAGLSAYADAVHTVGRLAWYPVDGGAGAPAFAQTGMETRRLRTLALGGLRYAFESGADARFEYVIDEAGWSRGDLLRAALAASADPRLVDRYLDPGFELLGRRLVYFSLLFPDLPPRQRTTAPARYLRCLTDGSGAAFATMSHGATDAVVVFLSASLTHGGESGALSRLARGTALLGAEVNW